MRTMAEARDDKLTDKAVEKAPKAARGAGWLAKIAPGVRNLVARRNETPDNLWIKCPDTGEMIYRPDLEAALWVTPAGRHMRIAPPLRFRFTFDDGVHETLPVPSVAEDPLHFEDQKPYPERLAAARKATGEPDAVALAFGRISETPAVVMVQDFAFLGGSLGMAAGETFIAGARAALEREVPFVAFCAAGGALSRSLGARILMNLF